MAVSKSSIKLTIRPLTPDLWPALEDLFGKNGACNGCWCMYWRIGTAYRKRPREQNKAAFREVVKRRPPPGLLAFDGDVAVGWCHPHRLRVVRLQTYLRPRSMEQASSGPSWKSARGKPIGLLGLEGHASYRLFPRRSDRCAMGD